MKLECGCEVDDEFLPKDQGERVLSCEHGRWKFVSVTVTKTHIESEFLDWPCDDS